MIDVDLPVIYFKSSLLKKNHKQKRYTGQSYGLAIKSFKALMNRKKQAQLDKGLNILLEKQTVTDRKI